MRGPKGTSKARSSPPERELRSDRGRRGERPGSTFRKGTRTTALGDRAARHAATPPESLDEEDLAKGRPSEPDRREREPEDSSVLEAPGAHAKPTRRPTGQGPRGQTRCTAHPVGYTSSYVVCRLRLRSIGRAAFAGGALGEGRGSRGGRAPGTENRAEVDARQRTGPNRSGSKPAHLRVGSNGVRRVARWVAVP